MPRNNLAKTIWKIKGTGKIFYFNIHEYNSEYYGIHIKIETDDSLAG